MKPNRIKAENIACGFHCGGDCDDEEDCAENGCADLRSDIEAALDAKDRKKWGTERQGVNSGD